MQPHLDGAGVSERKNGRAERGGFFARPETRVLIATPNCPPILSYSTKGRSVITDLKIVVLLTPCIPYL